MREDEAEQYRAMFKAMDRDGNGYITAKEYYQAMRMMCGHVFREKDAQMIVKSVDKDGDGRLSFPEFVRMNRLYDYMEMFREMDTDGSGFLSLEEFKRFLVTIGYPMTEMRAKRLHRMTDTDKDGKVDLKEFLYIMETLVGVD